MSEFDDGKDDGAFRTIGEVSEALDIKPHVLRYWEQQFSLLNPLKRSGGRRLYRPSDVEMVEAINRLVNEEGYTLKGAEAVLRSQGRSELDRRQLERRKGDRRSSTRAQGSDAAPPSVFTSGPDYSEAIAKLKSLRARLSKAIEV